MVGSGGGAVHFLADEETGAGSDPQGATHRQRLMRGGKDAVVLDVDRKSAAVRIVQTGSR